jgi:preprotein translocase subunit SecY
LLGLFDTFAGGAFSNASRFALGIMPYISASIFMQLMTILVPQMQKLQKEGDSGRKKINQWTRYLTAIVTLLQAGAYVAYLQNQNRDAMIESYVPFFKYSTMIILTAGTLFVMWLGEKIQDKGLGNGTSIIIMVGILAKLPLSIVQEFTAKMNRGGGGLLIFMVEVAVLIAVILGLILLVQGTRKIPVNYAKQIVGNRQFGGARQFLPLKVNAAGVMPIIFAQAIMFLPTLFSFTKFETGQGIANFQRSRKYLVHGHLCRDGNAFTLYTALIFNPKQMVDNLKQSNGFIPGVKPDSPLLIISARSWTASHCWCDLRNRRYMPHAKNLNVSTLFSTFFGGTSLLIMVGVYRTRCNKSKPNC